MVKHIVLATVFTFSLIACSGTKKTATSGTDNNGATAAENSKMEQENGTTESTVADNAIGGVAGQVNGSGGAMNNVQTFGSTTVSSVDYDQMFADLEMTDDQINSFRSAMEDFQKTRGNKPNGDMMESIEDERTSQLENILSKEQLEKYNQWQANNN